MSEKKELDKIREKIDELDAELLQLLNRRSSLAMEAGKKKKKKLFIDQKENLLFSKDLKRLTKAP